MHAVSDSLRILQVDSVYRHGGAAVVAYNLARSFRARGHRCWHVVGHTETTPVDVYRMPVAPSTRERVLAVASAAADRASPATGDLIRRVGRRLQHRRRAEPGRENFDFPGTRRLLSVPPERPDIVQCHNLHEGYFDLRELPRISRHIPTFVTLHDAWLLSGHCAHSFACERWKIGCGSCPDLTIPPAIPIDRTAENWNLKAEIYRRCRLFVATPSRWLMDKVEQSMLLPGITEARVIPNGVDLGVFAPAHDRGADRASLGLEADAFVVLFAANGIRDNVWKDIATLRAALGYAAERWKQRRRLRLLAVGEAAPAEAVGAATVEFVAYVDDPAGMAGYYRAADVYVHAARADTFPNTVLEALACGKPVAATAVGGITEQVRSLDMSCADRGVAKWAADSATGVLVPPGDAVALGEAILSLSGDGDLMRRLEHNARRDAEQRFDLERQASDYLDWYASVLATGSHRLAGSAAQSSGD